MKWERIEAGKYRSDCGRFLITKNEKSWGLPWQCGIVSLEARYMRTPIYKKLEGDRFVGGQTLTAVKENVERCLAHMEQEAGEIEREITWQQDKVNRMKAADTCPPDCDWLTWHNLKFGDKITAEELSEQHELLLELNLLYSEKFSDSAVLLWATENLEVEPKVNSNYHYKCGQLDLIVQSTDSGEKILVLDGREVHSYWIPEKDISLEVNTLAYALKEWYLDYDGNDKSVADLIEVYPASDGGYWFAVSELGADSEPAMASRHKIEPKEFPGLVAAIEKKLADNEMDADEFDNSEFSCPFSKIPA